MQRCCIFIFPESVTAGGQAMPSPQSCCMSSLQHGVLPTQSVPVLGDSPSVTGPTSTFSVFQMRARVQPRPPTPTDPHMQDPHMQTVINIPKNISRNFWVETCSLSLNVLKKKERKRKLYAATSLGEKEKFDTSHSVVGTIKQLW